MELSERELSHIKKAVWLELCRKSEELVDSLNGLGQVDMLFCLEDPLKKRSSSCLCSLPRLSVNVRLAFSDEPL